MSSPEVGLSIPFPAVLSSVHTRGNLSNTLLSVTANSLLRFHIQNSQLQGVILAQTAILSEQGGLGRCTVQTLSNTCQGIWIQYPGMF